MTSMMVFTLYDNARAHSLSLSSLLRTSIDYLSMNKNRFVDLINSQLHKPISHPEIENLPTLEIEYNRRNR